MSLRATCLVALVTLGVGVKVNLKPLVAKQTVQKPQISTWYINAQGEYHRQDCIEEQLKRQSMFPRKFKAVTIPEECTGKGQGFENCMERNGLADCIAGGVSFDEVAIHGSMNKGADFVRNNVIANWCSHKRALKAMAEENSPTRYFLLLEDDVIVKPKFRETIEDFIQNYQGNWGAVQIDPFGRVGKAVGTHGDLDVYRPGDGGDYWGLQALLVKKEGASRLVKWMDNHQVVPVDWMPRLNPKVFVAFTPKIAMNMESQYIQPKGKKKVWLKSFLKLPSFCAKDVVKSTISR